MDWSRAKTIFILSFLVLDIFLIIQIIDQTNASTYDYLSEVPIEEQMAADQIILPKLPEGPDEEFYIEANVKQFSEDDFFRIPNREFAIAEPHKLEVNLNNPYALGANWEIPDVNQFVKNHIVHGDKYRYWYYDEVERTITYYQQYDGKVFYNNKDGQIVLYLNDKNEIVSYTQTMLEDISEIKKQAILSAHDAVVILYKKRILESQGEVTDVDLGYYTLVPLKSSQILAPTWRISIAGKEDFYVNAVEGHVFNEESQIIK